MESDEKQLIPEEGDTDDKTIIDKPVISVIPTVPFFPQCLTVENLNLQQNNLGGEYNAEKVENIENVKNEEETPEKDKVVEISEEIMENNPKNSPENEPEIKLKNEPVIKPIPADYNIATISGGSTKGFIALGLLQYLIDNFYMKDVTIYRGTSIGCMICYLLIIGYTPLEIITYICVYRIFENVPCLNFTGMMSGEGSIPYTDIQNHLEKLTIEKLGKFVNFSQLLDITGKKLECPTFNVTQNKLEYLSVDTYPEMPCLTAIRMSCGLPILFSNFKYMGNYYIDGYLDNFPLPEDILPSDKIIGINMLTQSTGFNIGEKHMGEFMYYLIFLPVAHNVKLKVEKITSGLNKEQYDIIDIPHDDSLFNPLDLNLSCKVKLDLFSKGYSLGREYYKDKV